MCSIQEMKSGIQTIAKSKLPKDGSIYLYGSRARGDNREDSDWDILILLNKDSISADDFDNIAYPIVELGWTLNESVSPQIYTFNEWQKMSFMPYYKNVERDKIVIV